MAVLHRALFTWFLVLVFLILLVLRLDERTQWSWFIVFVPVWVFDSVLLTYVLFNMMSHCRNGRDRHFVSMQRKAWYALAAVLKTAAEILLCFRLERTDWTLPMYYVMVPVWTLLSGLVVDVFVTLLQHYRN